MRKVVNPEPPEPGGEVTLVAPLAAASFEEFVDDIDIEGTATGTVLSMEAIFNTDELIEEPLPIPVDLTFSAGSWTATTKHLPANGSVNRSWKVKLRAYYDNGSIVDSNEVTITLTPFNTAPIMSIVGGAITGAAGRYFSFGYTGTSVEGFPVMTMTAEVDLGSGYELIETATNDPDDPASPYTKQVSAKKPIPIARAGVSTNVRIRGTIGGTIPVGELVVAFTPSAPDYIAEVDTWLTRLTAAGSAPDNAEITAAYDRFVRGLQDEGINGHVKFIFPLRGLTWATVPTAGAFPYLRVPTGYATQPTATSFVSGNDHNVQRGVCASASGAEYSVSDFSLLTLTNDLVNGWVTKQNLSTWADVQGPKPSTALRSAPVLSARTTSPQIDIRTVRAAGPPETAAWQIRSTASTYSETPSSDLVTQGFSIITIDHGPATNEVAVRRSGVDTFHTGATSNTAYTTTADVIKFVDGDLHYGSLFGMGTYMGPANTLKLRNLIQYLKLEIDDYYGL
jgi:hypothetical protein